MANDSDTSKSSLWEQRESWDKEDRDMHLLNIIKNNKEYVDKGSFSPGNDEPGPDVSTRGPSLKR